MRRALEVLLPQSRGDETELAAMLTVPQTAAYAEELFVAISQLARQAAHDACKVLAGEPNVSAAVLHAYGEQVEDTIIRSATSEAEFRLPPRRSATSSGASTRPGPPPPASSACGAH